MEICLKRLITMIFVVLLVFSLVGCGGSGDVKENNKSKKDGSKNTKKGNDKNTETENNYPEWFLNQPKAEGVIYAVGVAKKQNPQLARETAIARARAEIGRVIKVKVSSMTKDFLEESGVGDKAQSAEFTQVVSKQVADNVISGSQVDKIFADGSTIYALVKLELKDMAGAIDEIMKANSAAYSKLSANKAFDELSKELKKIKSSDVETPKVINEE